MGGQSRAGRTQGLPRLQKPKQHRWSSRIQPQRLIPGTTKQDRAYLLFVRFRADTGVRTNAAFGRGDKIEQGHRGWTAKFLACFFDGFAQFSSAAKEHEVEPLQF